MLNGVEPLLIFNFFKILEKPDSQGFPILSKILGSIPLVPIPIYLTENSGGFIGEKISGIFIQSEDKHIDIETRVEPSVDKKVPSSQRGINSSVTINMIARTDSPFVSLLIAMSDLIFDKLVKSEYSVTYINKSIIVFDGLMQNFSCVQNKNNNIYEITMVLLKSTTSTVKNAAAATIKNVQPTGL